MSADVPSSALFAPKLVTVLREGYGLAAFRADAIAGLTVAIVALPLSMAIAIASGTGPERGLFTAIVGGFLISALGGSRFQVGGPAGAFIVLVAACVERHGVDGMLLGDTIYAYLTVNDTISLTVLAFIVTLLAALYPALLAARLEPVDALRGGQ